MKKTTDDNANRDELWDLLGKTRQPEPPRNFESNVLRAVRQAEGAAESNRLGEFLRALLQPVIYVPAALVLGAGFLFMPLATPPQSPAPPLVETPAATPDSIQLLTSLDAQEVEILLALDNYLESEDQDFWNTETPLSLQYP